MRPGRTTGPGRTGETFDYSGNHTLRETDNKNQSLLNSTGKTAWNVDFVSETREWT